jgi:hypothetical protein
VLSPATHRHGDLAVPVFLTGSVWKEESRMPRGMLGGASVVVQDWDKSTPTGQTDGQDTER